MGIFDKSKPAPAPKPPAPLPDEFSPSIIAAKEKKQADILGRSGRQSTLLSQIYGGYDTFSGKKVG